MRGGGHIRPLLSSLVAIALMLSYAPGARAEAEESKTQQTASNKIESADETSPLDVELELDAYYSAADLLLSLTNTPVPEAGDKTEYEIYTDLLLGSYKPRFVALEASIYPMPALGAFARKNMEHLYEDMEMGEDLNLIQAVTAGFEEPYALSLFVGNLVRYKRRGQKGNKAGNMGWIGYLVSHGDYHIKDNVLVYDKWYEFEWKIKGDRKFADSKHSWSFRIGLKYHDNPDINDVVYVSARRSRLEFNSSAFSIIKNSAFEYTYDMASEDLSVVQHKFYVEKKFPMKKYKTAFTLAVGLIWDSGRKYKGDLAPEGDKESYQIIIRPNLEF